MAKILFVKEEYEAVDVTEESLSNIKEGKGSQSNHNYL